jgi:AcrR family transcriptional regulator
MVEETTSVCVQTNAIGRRCIVYLKPKDSRLRYTKSCLFESFLGHLETKNVSDITVSEICEDAGISRQTFYKYYSDQFDLLVAMQDDLFEEFKARIENLPPDISVITPALIALGAEHRVLLCAAFANQGTGNFIDRVLDYLFETYHGVWEELNPNLSLCQVEFLFYYVTSGLVGVVRHWLFEQPDMGVEEVNACTQFLIEITTPEDALRKS